MKATIASETATERPAMAGYAGCYLRFCAAHLYELHGSVVRHDARRVQRIGHVMRRNTSRLGLTDLAKLAARLEERSLHRDWAAVYVLYCAIARTIVGLCRGRPTSIAITFAPPRRTRWLRVVRT